MKRPLVLTACVVAVASAAALWAASSSAGAALRPVVPATDLLRRAAPVAAEQARGRRVLVLEADPGKPRTCEILESGRAPEGWSLFPAVPPASGEFGAWLQTLAAAAGSSWDRDRGVPDGLRGALALFAVKAVVVDDAGKGATPLVVLDEAEPVLRVAAPAGDADVAAAKDAVALAAALRATPGRESDGWTWSDWDDAIWGGGVTVSTERPARFVFPYPAVGGRVTVDGKDAVRGAAGPLLLLDLPAGASRVEVRFAEAGKGEVLAVLGAAGLVLSVFALIAGFRPSRAEVQAESERRAAGDAAADGDVSDGDVLK